MFRGLATPSSHRRSGRFGLGADSPLRTGLRAWWGAGPVTGLIAPDLSERGFTGTLVNTSWDYGQDGGFAYRFSGAGYVTRPAAVITGYPFSMGCWFNPDATDERAIIQVGQDAGSNQFLIYLRASNSRPTFFVNGSVMDTGQVALVGTWQFVLVSCVSNVERTFYFYNGTTLFSATDTTNLTPVSLDVTSLGRQRDGGGDFGLFSGRIEWATWWNRAVSPVEAMRMVLEASRWSLMGRGILRPSANFSPEAAFPRARMLVWPPGALGRWGAGVSQAPVVGRKFQSAAARRGVVIGVGVH